MSSEVEEKLKEINIEDYIWIIYILIIFLSWYSNQKEIEYFLYKNAKDKETYRCLMVLIFSILLVIYLYFLKSSWDYYKKLTPNDSEKRKNLSAISLVASLLITVSGIIFLYIALVDEELDIELAFN